VGDEVVIVARNARRPREIARHVRSSHRPGLKDQRCPLSRQPAGSWASGPHARGRISPRRSRSWRNRPPEAETWLIERRGPPGRQESDTRWPRPLRSRRSLDTAPGSRRTAAAAPLAGRFAEGGPRLDPLEHQPPLPRSDSVVAADEPSDPGRQRPPGRALGENGPAPPALPDELTASLPAWPGHTSSAQRPVGSQRSPLPALGSGRGAVGSCCSRRLPARRGHQGHAPPGPRASVGKDPAVLA